MDISIAIATFDYQLKLKDKDMTTTTQKFQINPSVVEAEFRIQVPIEILDGMGWEFSDIYENYAERKGLELEEAQKEVFENTMILLTVEGEKDNLKTFWTIQSFKEGTSQLESESDKQTTVDDEATLENICTYLADVEYPSDNDMSVDENDNYVPLFVSVSE